MATESFWVRFGRWRRGRPFWGGLLLVLSGLEMFFSANMELDNIEIHIGPQGFLSYLLPVIMLICGALTWITPAQRLFYGIVGTLTALYSFVGLNLGGWIVGMLLGIVGGALAIAWGPPRQPPVGTGGTPPGEPGPPAVSDSTIVPGLDPQAAPDPNRRPPHRKALMLIVPLAVAGAVAAMGNPPADAAECPEGLPSRTATATPTPKKSTGKPAKPGKSVAPSAAAPSPSASAPVPAEEGTGNPILDGIGDVVEGIGDLLGIGDDDNATPAPSPSAVPSAAAPSSAAPARPVAPSRSATKAPAPKPSRSAEEIPCLGPRQEGVLAAADGLPQVGLKPGIMKVGSLTMYNSTYEGVTELPTRNGTIRALSFVMDKAVNKPFSLEIDEPGDATTLIKSNELITDGNVEFYTPRMTGKLFGLIPVTFTPEQPPPLTLPILWFTDVTIDLAYVRCDVLTADPIAITET
ncbi:DUF6114 domain-containing protein [Actinoplanes aureus]|uniref:Uncharacterized protein n=1 Tax=Actinoplanes aureus TaxID=2792083 RepID=A0A931C9T6_9ACTN|nr:DUF6114 domain-containing protein [Actinoplanes aureus]MBG0564799.1 hypothetical protein [Actinoplanes aureus]